METLLALPYPKEDLDEISRLVRENESFVALMTGDIYNIRHYRIPSPVSNFSAILDRNVYTRVTALVRGKQLPDHALADHRWAAAVIAFCQIAGIRIHYASSLQEYASAKGGASALDDLECFHKADNCDPKALIEFAMGRTDTLDLSSVEKLKVPDLPVSAKDFEEPIYEFRLNYILALKIALLDRDSKNPPEKRILSFIDWMDNEFRLGSAALQFANLLFSPARMKGMLKKRNLKDVRNIAWDFALIQNWRGRALEGTTNSEPVILATRDKVVKFIARRLVSATDEEFRSFLLDPWEPSLAKGEAVFQRYMELHQKLSSQASRVLIPDEELDAITDQLEQHLLAES